MSAQYGKVISVVLQERFGDVISKVGSLLFHFGACTLGYLVRSTQLPLTKVKEALCVLIKYGLVSYALAKNETTVLYTLQSDRVVLMLRYPKYINFLGKKFGKEAETLLEILLQSGYATGTELVLKTAKKLEKDKRQLSVIKEQLLSLITARYLTRQPKPFEPDTPVPLLTIEEHETYQHPNVDLKIVLRIREGDEDVVPEDAGVYWSINFDRFHQDFRDNLLIQAVTKKFDDNCGELMRILLMQMYIRTEPWANVSNPIPGVEIKDQIKKLSSNHPQLIVYVDQYLNILEEDNCKFIRKTGDASGGQFTIFMKDAFTELTWQTLENVVLEKFDTKAARIFRLVRAKKYIESEQIQQLAMIPAKEAKGLSYKLLEEGFLQFQELRKAPSNSGPYKAFTLFQIVLDQVVRMVLEICYKAIFNVLTRRHHDRSVNKRLIDKKQRVQTIAMGMRTQGADEDQLNDIEDMITPPEREVLEKIGKTMKKLHTAELELDETLFLLQLYLSYN